MEFEPGYLRSVNSSRPELVRVPSQRSISASDDYYSVSEASQTSSDDRTTVIRYHTPIEQAASAIAEAKRSATQLAANDHATGVDKSVEAPAPLSSHPQPREPPVESALSSARSSAADSQDTPGLSAAVFPKPPQSAAVSALREEEKPLPVTPSESGDVDTPRPGTSRRSSIDSGQPVILPPVGKREIQLHNPASELARPTTTPSPLPHPPGAYPQNGAVRFAEDEPTVHKIPRKAVNSAEMGQWQGAPAETSTTPGADDTPYIQFAIEQLTRDEELIGRSRDRSGSPDMTPVDSPHTAHTAAAVAASGVAGAAAAHEVSPLSSDDEGHQRTDRGLAAGPSDPQRASLGVSEPSRRSPPVSPVSANVPLPLRPQEPPAGGQPVASRLPPHDLYRYPPLTFIPASLRLPALGLLILPCFIFITLLLLSVIWAAKHGGLWLYDGVGTRRYFLAQYLPQLLAALHVIYTHVVQTALQRILPFVLLSRKRAGATPDVFHGVPLFITTYLTPNFSLFQRGELVLAYASVSFWLNLFTVPLASSLYQTRLYTPDSGVWKWTTVAPVGIVLAALYLNLVVMLLALHLRLRRYPTGLKWDPVSLADILVLVRKSTAVDDGEDDVRSSFNPKRASLGYWESSSQPGDFYHGLGAAPSTARLEVEHGRTVPARTERGPGQPKQSSTFDSWRSKRVSNRLQPWFLRESPLILFAVIATVLMAAFLVASYLHSALAFGFNPRLATATDATAAFQSFSPSNFLFSFIPSVVGLLAPLLWIPLDTAARYFAPYMALVNARGPGVTTEGSMLLSYASDPPFVATVRAASHGDYTVAASSLLSLLAWALPILGGGLFTAQYVPSAGEIVMRADPMGLGALTTFVVVCALGWIAAWPVASHKLRGGLLRSGTQGRRSAEKAAAKGPEAADAAPRGSLEAWLCGTDLRYLGGIHDAMGDAVLTAGMWREPRTREDLIGRLIGRGRSRWSWQGAPGAGGGGISQQAV